MEQWLLDMCMEFVKRTDGVILGQRHLQPGQKIFFLLRVHSLPPLLFPLPMSRSAWNVSIHCTHYKPLIIVSELTHDSLTVSICYWEDEFDGCNTKLDQQCWRCPHHFSSPPSEAWLIDLLSLSEKGPWINTLLLVGNRHPTAHIGSHSLLELIVSGYPSDCHIAN